MIVRLRLNFLVHENFLNKFSKFSFSNERFLSILTKDNNLQQFIRYS